MLCISLTVYSTPSVQFNENSEPLGRNHETNTRLVDTIGIVLFMLPICTWLPLAYLTGYFAEINNPGLANIFFTVHYLAFAVWGILYLMALICFWYKLKSVIEGYIKVLEERYVSSGAADKSCIECIKKGARDVSILHWSIIRLQVYMILKSILLLCR